ncbi:hypothetical protein D9M71_345710 [compost metagenome]
MFATLKHDLQAADAQGEQGEADVVDALRAFLVDRVMHAEPRQKDRHSADRQVDQKDPVPGEFINQVTAHRGPQGRSHHYPDPVQGQASADLFLGEHVVDDRLGDTQQATAGQALDNPKGHQLPEFGGHRAAQRGQYEQDRGNQVVVAPAEPGRQPATGREDYHVGDDVTGRDPGNFIHRGAEAAHQAGNGNVDDSDVEQLHHRDQGHAEGDQPGRFHKRCSSPVSTSTKALMPWLMAAW